MSLSDFWWFGPSEKAKYKYVELVHHEVSRNDDQYGHRETYAICDMDSIQQWREKFQNTNVYRSLKVVSAPSGGQGLLGPFLVDIDNASEDLEDTLDAARKAAHYLKDALGLTASELRIFFTGRKGFNLEVRPEALGIAGSLGNQIQQSADKLDDIVKTLRGGNTWQTANQVTEGGTIVDRIYGSRRFGYGLKHPDIRLHGSINKWVTSDGKPKARKKIELTVDELRALTAKEIVTKSESLAR